MPEISADARAIVDAVQDLTRVTVALHGNFASQSDAVRRLTELSIPPARIAAILSMAPGDVHSALAKAKKRENGGEGGNGRVARGKRPKKPSAERNSAAQQQEATDAEGQ